MIVCICNNLSSDDIQRAIDAGCSDYESVLRFLGVEPNCFSCEADVSISLNRMMLHEESH